MEVVLGAHNLQDAEPSQQRFSVARQFGNNYDPEQKLNDILLLQVGALASPLSADTWPGTQQAWHGESHSDSSSTNGCPSNNTQSHLPPSAQPCPTPTSSPNLGANLTFSARAPLTLAGMNDSPDLWFTMSSFVILLEVGSPGLRGGWSMQLALNKCFVNECMP